MQIQLDKARKLIDRLEKTLNETSNHTTSAREVLNQWLTKGEATLRAKSAAALKQVRRRADRFTEALTELEKSFAKSLDKLSREVAPKTAAAVKAPAKAKKKKANGAAAGNKAPVKKAKPDAKS